MSVHPDEERTVDVVRLAIEANCLRDGHDMRFVEGELESGASMTRGPERDALRGDRRIGPLRIVRGYQSRNVYQHRGRSRLTSQGTYFHDSDWASSESRRTRAVTYLREPLVPSR